MLAARGRVRVTPGQTPAAGSAMITRVSPDREPGDLTLLTLTHAGLANLYASVRVKKDLDFILKRYGHAIELAKDNPARARYGSGELTVGVAWGLAR